VTLMELKLTCLFRCEPEGAICGRLRATIRVIEKRTKTELVSRAQPFWGTSPSLSWLTWGIVLATRTGDPMRLLIAATTATLLVAQAALAQNPSSDRSQMAGVESTVQAQQAKVERTLEGAGFTDIEIMPTAFLVRAKNAEGKRVIMVVDPITLTASVIENSRSAPEDATTGSASPK
jgi:hypothetical protein